MNCLGWFFFPSTVKSDSILKHRVSCVLSCESRLLLVILWLHPGVAFMVGWASGSDQESIYSFSLVFCSLTTKKWPIWSYTDCSRWSCLDRKKVMRFTNYRQNNAAGSPMWNGAIDQRNCNRVRWKGLLAFCDYRSGMHLWESGACACCIFWW